MEDHADVISIESYVYLAIATHRDQLSDNESVHWYNQRAEGSENRIKELKLDLGGANALYFRIATLSLNLFALMRALLLEGLSRPTGFIRGCSGDLGAY